MEMVRELALFACGPALPAFAAWLDQEAAARNEQPAPDVARIVENLERLVTVIDIALGTSRENSEE